MAEMKRIEVGFVGHQVITLKLDESQLSDLRKKLADGGWQTVTTDDGEVFGTPQAHCPLHLHG